jgi:hypothetical protein
MVYQVACAYNPPLLLIPEEWIGCRLPFYRQDRQSYPSNNPGVFVWMVVKLTGYGMHRQDLKQFLVAIQHLYSR